MRSSVVPEEVLEADRRGAGDLLDGVCRVGHDVAGDGGVGADPGVELPRRGAVGGAGGVGLLDRLVVERDGAAADVVDDAGDIGQRQRLRAGEVVGVPGVGVRVQEHRGCDAGDVGARDDRAPPAAGRATDDAVCADELLHEVDVEGVAQERPRHAGGPQVLLGRVVVAGQGERRVRRCRGERGVDDVPHAGGGRRVDEGGVFGGAGGALVRGDHEQHLDTLQRRLGQILVGVVDAGDLGDRRELRQSRTGWVAHEQPLRATGGVQVCGDEAADVAGGAGDGDGGLVHGRAPSVGFLSMVRGSGRATLMP